MKIWFPDFYTEAHRSPEARASLVRAFTELGVKCVPEPESGCDLCFCGSIYSADKVRVAETGMSVVHYNWDLYPWMLMNDRTLNWKEYLEDLKTCLGIVVPNTGTAVRTKEYTGRGCSTVVRAPVQTWEPPADPPRACPWSSGFYVLDVMRDYKWDPNRHLAEEVCKAARIPLVRTLTTRPWDEFRWLVANARLLLSCYEEASTGGLTLLEGYAHGVQCILNDHPMMGAQEYFGERGLYFNHKDPVNSLTSILKARWKAWRRPKPEAVVENRIWVQVTFGDHQFAKSLLEVFQRCLTDRSIRERN
jgi:hypothetical protein